MCSYLTGAGAQAAPSRPRPPPLRKFGKDGRANRKSGRFAGEHDAGGSRRLEIAAHVADFLRVTFRVPRCQRFKAKTASRVDGLKRRETSRTFQSAICNRHSSICLVGTLAAVPGGITLRAVRMPASKPTSRAIVRFYLAAVRAGLVRSARAGKRACRWRATARRHARARFW
jgi:hypothetical protein